MPDANQTISAMFTLPVCFNTPVGDTKMPEPMIDPTITVHPFKRLIFAFSPTSPPPPLSAQALSVVATASSALVLRWSSLLVHCRCGVRLNGFSSDMMMMMRSQLLLMLLVTECKKHEKQNRSRHLFVQSAAHFKCQKMCIC